jgi:hypothetical protein
VSNCQRYGTTENGLEKCKEGCRLDAAGADEGKPWPVMTTVITAVEYSGRFQVMSMVCVCHTDLGSTLRCYTDWGTTCKNRWLLRKSAVLCSVLYIDVTAYVVPSSPILSNLMIEAIYSTQKSVSTRATWRNILEDGILHSHRRENFKSYIALTGWALYRRRNASPVR